MQAGSGERTQQIIKLEDAKEPQDEMIASVASFMFRCTTDENFGRQICFCRISLEEIGVEVSPYTIMVDDKPLTRKELL